MDDKRADEDAAHIEWKVEAGEQVEGEAVEEKVYKVGEGSVLAQSQVLQLQSVHLAPDSDGESWQQQSPECHNNQYQRLEGHRQQTQVGEHEKRHEAHQWEVLRAEDIGEDASAKE